MTGQGSEMILWNGILCVKGVYACPAQLASNISIASPEDLGKCLNLKWQVKNSAMVDNYIKLMPTAGMLQKGEIFSKSWYFNICTLRPLDSKDRFSKIQEHLLKTGSISVVKTGKDILLIMPGTELTEELGLMKCNQSLHCIVMSKTSKLFKGTKKTSEFLTIPPVSSVLRLDKLQEAFHSCLEQKRNIKSVKAEKNKVGSEKDKNNKDTHTVDKNRIQEEKRHAQSSEEHPERKRHKSDHIQAVSHGVDKAPALSPANSDKLISKRKRHKSETPRKHMVGMSPVNKHIVRQSPVGNKIGKSGLDESSKGPEIGFKISIEQSPRIAVHSIEKCQDNKKVKVMKGDIVDTHRDTSTKKKSKKDSVSKLSALEKKQIESEKVMSQLQLGHSKENVKSLGRIPKKKQIAEASKQLTNENKLGKREEEKTDKKSAKTTVHSFDLQKTHSKEQNKIKSSQTTKTNKSSKTVLEKDQLGGINFSKVKDRDDLFEIHHTSHSLKEDIRFSAQEPELSYERDNRVDLFMLEKSPEINHLPTLITVESLPCRNLTMTEPSYGYSTAHKDMGEIPGLGDLDKLRDLEYKNRLSKVDRLIQKTDDGLSVKIKDASVGIECWGNTASFAEFVSQSLHRMSKDETNIKSTMCPSCLAVAIVHQSNTSTFNRRKATIDKASPYDIKIEVSCPAVQQYRRYAIQDSLESRKEEIFLSSDPSSMYNATEKTNHSKSDSNNHLVSAPQYSNEEINHNKVVRNCDVKSVEDAEHVRKTGSLTGESLDKKEMRDRTTGSSDVVSQSLKQKSVLDDEKMQKDVTTKDEIKSSYSVTDMKRSDDMDGKVKLKDSPLEQLAKQRSERRHSGEKSIQNTADVGRKGKTGQVSVQFKSGHSDNRDKVSSGCELSEKRSKGESVQQRLEKIAEMKVPAQEGKSKKSERREERQFHPYKKDAKSKRSKKPTWSFDIAYSDMEELLQNLTENMFKMDERRQADVRKWRKGTSRNSLSHVRGRFYGLRFVRSEVPESLRETEDDYRIDPELISNLEERSRQADMVEESWQSKGQEETVFMEEMCIYNQEKESNVSESCTINIKPSKPTMTLEIPGAGISSMFSGVDLEDMDGDSEEVFVDNNPHREITESSTSSLERGPESSSDSKDKVKTSRAEMIHDCFNKNEDTLEDKTETSDKEYFNTGTLEFGKETKPLIKTKEMPLLVKEKSVKVKNVEDENVEVRALEIGRETITKETLCNSDCCSSKPLQAREFRILSSESDVCLDWSDDECLSVRDGGQSASDDDPTDKTFVVIDTLENYESDATSVKLLETSDSENKNVSGSGTLDVKVSLCDEGTVEQCEHVDHAIFSQSSIDSPCHSDLNNVADFSNSDLYSTVDEVAEESEENIETESATDSEIIVNQESDQERGLDLKTESEISSSTEQVVITFLVPDDKQSLSKSSEIDFVAKPKLEKRPADSEITSNTEKVVSAIFSPGNVQSQTKAENDFVAKPELEDKLQGSQLSQIVPETKLDPEKVFKYEKEVETETTTDKMMAHDSLTDKREYMTIQTESNALPFKHTFSEVDCQISTNGRSENSHEEKERYVDNLVNILKVENEEILYKNELKSDKCHSFEPNHEIYLSIEQDKATDQEHADDTVLEKMSSRTGMKYLHNNGKQSSLSHVSDDEDSIPDFQINEITNFQTDGMNQSFAVGESEPIKYSEITNNRRVKENMNNESKKQTEKTTFEKADGFDTSSRDPEPALSKIASDLVPDTERLEMHVNGNSEINIEKTDLAATNLEMTNSFDSSVGDPELVISKINSDILQNTERKENIVNIESLRLIEKSNIGKTNIVTTKIEKTCYFDTLNSDPEQVVSQIKSETMTDIEGPEMNVNTESVQHIEKTSIEKSSCCDTSNDIEPIKSKITSVLVSDNESPAMSTEPVNSSSSPLPVDNCIDTTYNTSSPITTSQGNQHNLRYLYRSYFPSYPPPQWTLTTQQPSSPSPRYQGYGLVYESPPPPPPPTIAECETNNTKTYSQAWSHYQPFYSNNDPKSVLSKLSFHSVPETKRPVLNVNIDSLKLTKKTSIEKNNIEKTRNKKTNIEKKGNFEPSNNDPSKMTSDAVPETERREINVNTEPYMHIQGTNVEKTHIEKTHIEKTNIENSNIEKTIVEKSSIEKNSIEKPDYLDKSNSDSVPDLSKMIYDSLLGTERQEENINTESCGIIEKTNIEKKDNLNTFNSESEPGPVLSMIKLDSATDIKSPEVNVSIESFGNIQKTNTEKKDNFDSLNSDTELVVSQIKSETKTDIEGLEMNVNTESVQHIEKTNIEKSSCYDSSNDIEPVKSKITSDLISDNESPAMSTEPVNSSSSPLPMDNCIDTTYITSSPITTSQGNQHNLRYLYRSYFPSYPPPQWTLTTQQPSSPSPRYQGYGLVYESPPPPPTIAECKTNNTKTYSQAWSHYQPFYSNNDPKSVLSKLSFHSVPDTKRPVLNVNIDSLKLKKKTCIGKTHNKKTNIEKKDSFEPLNNDLSKNTSDTVPETERREINVNAESFTHIQGTNIEKSNIEKTTIEKNSIEKPYYLDKSNSDSVPDLSKIISYSLFGTERQEENINTESCGIIEKTNIEKKDNLNTFNSESEPGPVLSTIKLDSATDIKSPEMNVNNEAFGNIQKTNTKKKDNFDSLNSDTDLVVSQIKSETMTDIEGLEMNVNTESVQHIEKTSIEKSSCCDSSYDIEPVKSKITSDLVSDNESPAMSTEPVNSSSSPLPVDNCIDTTYNTSSPITTSQGNQHNLRYLYRSYFPSYPPPQWTLTTQQPSSPSPRYQGYGLVYESPPPPPPPTIAECETNNTKTYSQAWSHNQPFYSSNDPKSVLSKLSFHSVPDTKGPVLNVNIDSLKLTKKTSIEKNIGQTNNIKTNIKKEEEFDTSSRDPEPDLFKMTSDIVPDTEIREINVNPESFRHIEKTNIENTHNEKINTERKDHFDTSNRVSELDISKMTPDSEIPDINVNTEPSRRIEKTNIENTNNENTNNEKTYAEKTDHFDSSKSEPEPVLSKVTSNSKSPEINGNTESIRHIQMTNIEKNSIEKTQHEKPDCFDESNSDSEPDLSKVTSASCPDTKREEAHVNTESFGNKKKTISEKKDKFDSSKGDTKPVLSQMISESVLDRPVVNVNTESFGHIKKTIIEKNNFLDTSSSNTETVKSEIGSDIAPDKKRPEMCSEPPNLSNSPVLLDNHADSTSDTASSITSSQSNQHNPVSIYQSNYPSYLPPQWTLTTQQPSSPSSRYHGYGLVYQSPPPPPPATTTECDTNSTIAYNQAWSDNQQYYSSMYDYTTYNYQHAYLNYNYSYPFQWMSPYQTMSPFSYYPVGYTNNASSLQYPWSFSDSYWNSY